MLGGSLIGLTFTGKIVVKVGLNAVVPGAGYAVDVLEVVKNVVEGDYLSAVIGTTTVITDIVTAGSFSVFKDLAKKSGKEAVSQAAKENAKIAAKKATKIVGAELAKNLASGTITSTGKTAAIGAAKAAADSAAKEATKKVGQQVGKDLAKGLIHDTFEKVFYDGTKTTFENLAKSGVFSVVSSGGQNVAETVTKDLLQEFGEKTLEEFIKRGGKRNAQYFVCEFAKKAALQSAEKEFAKYATNKLYKDGIIATLKGGLNFFWPFK